MLKSSFTAPLFLLGCSAFLSCCSAKSPRGAPSAYDTADSGWGGLSKLVELARTTETHIAVPIDSLPLDELEPSDGLLILRPENDLPTEDLQTFLQSGGRLVIADDEGRSTKLLKRFGIARRQPRVPDDWPRLRRRVDLPLALRHASHPVTQGVTAVATNRPAAFEHAHLQPLFELGTGTAFALAGMVGRGRLVAVSDPSALTNQMLRLSGNRRFAANLLRYLQIGGTVYIVSPRVRFVGSLRGSGSDLLSSIRKWLRSASAANIPPVALQLSALLVLSLATLLAASWLPVSSPYEAALPPRDANRAFRTSRPSNRATRRRLRLELENAFRERLGTAALAQPEVLEATLKARGMPPPLRSDFVAFLHRVHTFEERPKAFTFVDKRLKTMAAEGDRWLRLIGSPPATPTNRLPTS